MEKIKSILHPHGHDKDRETAGDVSHDVKGTAGTTAQSSTVTPATTSGTTGHQSTPIYDEMTGHSKTSSDTPKFSNTPNVGAGAGTSTGTGTGTTTSTGLGDDRHAGNVGTDGPIGGARVAGAPTDGSHMGDSTRTAENTRPQVSSGTYDGNSEASIKSGVIGFTPGQAGQSHAALPNDTSVEDRLNRNQVVGQGNTGTNTSSGLRNEVAQEQPSTVPVSSAIGHHGSSNPTTNTDRSFPLSGGVSSGSRDPTSTAHGAHGTSGTPELTTSEREPGTKEREVAARDSHGREGLAGAAALAAGTAAATHGRHDNARDPQVGSVSDRNTSPTGHTHLTSSVREHNIHPDALVAAGAQPLKDSDDPAHGAPHETPHVNTGTLLDYEKAYGSDPHTHHTGLLGYRPHTHRSDTSPHIPGEFPEATPDNERSGPILAGTGSTSGTTSTVPSTSHDLRHTGTLDEPTSRSTDQSGHHLGRDAAIAGGGGAAGLGAAAHHRNDTQTTGTGNLYDERNPYTAKALDPRVSGGEPRLNEQSFGPSATSSASTTQPLASSSAAVPPPKSEDRQHNYGRDAAIAGGALGAGALAGNALSGDRHGDANLADSSSLPTTQHTTGTTNPSTVGTTSTSHQLPSAQHTSGSTTSGPASATTGPHKSDTLNRADPRIDDKAGQHHYGRDAAVAGGAGLAGYGAYEAAQAYGDHRSTQPGASMQEQRYDPSAAGARAPNPVPASSEYNYHNPDVAALAGSTGSASGYHGSTTGQTQQPYTTAQLAQSASSQPPQAYKSPEIDDSDLGPRDNSSRNAALGAGAGLAGTAAAGYGLSQHGDKTHPTATTGASTQPGTSTLSQPTGSLQGRQDPYNADPSQSHTSRNAALAGGAGAMAGAGAGYAYGQRTQPQFDPKEQERLEKETAKRQHELEKQHDKDVHKLEKQHDKDAHKLEKEREKEREKEIKKHEKEAAKHDEKEQEKEKKGGILGFLHRDKSKKEKKDRSPESSPRHSSERRSGESSGEDKFGHGSGYKGRNLLHKEPPEGHPARDALHSNDRVGTDGPIGVDRKDEHHYGRDAAIGGGAVGAGALGAHELSKDRAEPSTLSSTTGTAPATRDTVGSGQHASGLSGAQTTLPDRTREEHHYGRDTALAGGAVAAGGLAAHQLHNKQTDPTSTTIGHSGTGLAGSQQATIPQDTAPGSVVGNRTQQPVQDTFVSGKREHIGVDGPIGDPNLISGDRQTRQGVWGAHPVSDLAQDHTVIEPRTGLPMNVGRYGDGAGGIDAGPVGHRQPETVSGQVLPGSVDTQHAETDWEGVAKKNTIY